MADRTVGVTGAVSGRQPSLAARRRPAGVVRWPLRRCVLPAHPVSLLAVVGTLRIPEFQHARFHQWAEVAVDQHSLVHREPARELAGGGPFADPADVENQGMEDVAPGAER